MGGSNRKRMLLMALLALTSGACATASNPWRNHDATADIKAFTADPARMCPVVLGNATDQTLEAQVGLEGEDHPVGLLPAGQSVTLDVSCSARRVFAMAVSQDLNASEGTHYRKSAVLDVMKVTNLSFTQSDRVRR